MEVYVSWDTDGMYVDNLPEIVDVPDGINEEDIADWLSDEYGWCVDSYEIV